MTPGPAARELVLSGYADVVAALDHPDLEPAGILPIIHRSVRPALADAVHPELVRSLRPMIDEIVESNVTRLQESASFDVVKALAEPITRSVMAYALGLTPADVEHVARHLPDLWLVADQNPFDADRPHVETAMALAPVFAATARRGLAGSGGPLLQRICGALPESGRQTGQGLRAIAIASVVLYIAGQVTTTNLIGTSVLTLMNNRAQLDRIRQGLVSPRTVVEELLRFNAPVWLTVRVARQDTLVARRHVGTAEQVLLGLGAANRDPSRFTDADRFDPSRAETRHLSFGRGRFTCPGAALARAEVEVVVRALAACPDLYQVGEPEWRQGKLLHGLAHLEVAFHAR